MKRTIHILILASLMLIVIDSCKKKDKQELETSSFTINGNHWNSEKLSSSWQSDSKFSFSYGKGIHKSGEIGNTYNTFDEILNFNLIDKKLGRQIIPIITFAAIAGLNQDSPPFAVFGTFHDEGCVGCEMFYVGGTDVENNWIEITKQEDNFKKIWGKFSLTMVKDSIDCDLAHYPNVIQIRNGEFYLKF